MTIKHVTYTFIPNPYLQAARVCGINYSTAKSIVKLVKTEGRLEKKKKRIISKKKKIKKHSHNNSRQKEELAFFDQNQNDLEDIDESMIKRNINKYPTQKQEFIL